MAEGFDISTALAQLEPIVRALDERWDELSPEAQELIQDRYLEFRQAYADGQPLALILFLEALDRSADARALVGPLLDEAKGPARRGGAIATVDFGLLSRLPAYLGPRQPADPRLAPVQPALASARLLEIVARLQERGHRLTAEEQEQAMALYDELVRATCYADTSLAAKMEAAARFVEGVDALPGARALLAPLLDATRLPGSSKAPIDPERWRALPPTLEPPRRGARMRAEPPAEAAAEAEEPRATSFTRYPALDCPDQAILNVPFSLFVQLLIEAPEPGAEGVTIEDTEVEEPQVDVIVRVRGLGLEGGNMQTMTVARAEDSEVRFVLTPRALGEHQIRVDLYQKTRRLATLRHNVLVVAQPTVATVSQPEGPGPVILSVRPLTPPPDLELCIELDRHDGRTLYFSLHSTKDDPSYNHFRCGQVTLQGSPLEKMQGVYRELSKLAGADPATPEAQRVAVQRLEALGCALWDELVPEELKREYWRFRDKVKSLLITSDEPWVPWEMVKPYRFDDEDRREDAPFWCQQFDLSRWLAGPGAVDRLPTGVARPVAPAQVDLVFVREEVEFIERLGALRPDVAGLAPVTSRAQVLDLINQDQEAFSLLHFACHGLFDATNPNDSAIVLGGEPLRPSDLRGRFGGRRPRPLIFINACHGGRAEFSFTGLGGWADRLVQNARVGAFIGALWEVNDALAVQFARHFYTALLAGDVSIGEAFRQAREAIRQAKPHNSTWLAYVLYADPEGRLAA